VHSRRSAGFSDAVVFGKLGVLRLRDVHLAWVNLTSTWQLHILTFQAPTTANDGTVQFNVGPAAATIWIDAVQLAAAPADVYRRDFTQGAVLLNGTNSPQTLRTA
jgi:hypothetical protein